MNTIKHPILIALSVVLCIAACNVSNEAPDVPTIPSWQLTPPAGTPVLVAEPIVIVFSESMDTSSLTVSGPIADASDGGTWASSAEENDTLTLSPLSAWSGSSGWISVAVSSAAGVVLDLTMSFIFDSLPEAVSMPQDGQILDSNEPVIIRFSESMDPTNLTLGGTMASDSDGGVWSDGLTPNSVLTLSPSIEWEAGSGNLTVATTDTSGQSPIADPLSFTFNVRNVEPDIVSINYPDGSLIGTQAFVVVQFSESMNTGSLSIVGSMGAEASTPVWSTTVHTNDTVTVMPLMPGAWSTMQDRELILQGATDLEGQMMSTTTLTYNVIDLPPYVTSVVPSGSASTTEPLVITFSESMNPINYSFPGGSLRFTLDSANVTWSTALRPNDTLTIPPGGGSWQVGFQDLQVTAEDVDGNLVWPTSPWYGLWNFS